MKVGREYSFSSFHVRGSWQGRKDLDAGALSLNIPDKQIKELDTLAKKLKANRSAYIR